ncbi:MAG TPA: hypothetical protein VGU20_02120 [Stellaceae bacterium]|nr:hypothetical protein [Stellaceae bacterium]
MNLLRLLSPMVAILVLTACESAPPRPNFPDIHITGEAPIRLAVGGIDIRNDFKPSFQPPHVEHLYPIPPAHAMENWARDRLVGLVGGNSNARAVFVIADASVVESELKKKEEGITGAFTKEPAQRYDATVEATLNIIDDRGTPVRTVTVKAFRSQTVLEGITPNEREQAWYDMTKALMNDFDRQMTTEISAHFGGYFQ